MKRLPNGYHIIARADTKEHDIFLYGVIGWDYDIEALFADIEKIPQGTETLNFFLDSPGGFVQSGFTLLTNIRRLNQRYHTRGFIDGLAASMGSAIAVTFHETVASPTSQMMIHDVMAGLDIWGSYNQKQIRELVDDLEEVAQHLKTDSDILAWPYSVKTGLTLDQVKEKWMNDGTSHWLSPQQMLSEGLIDRIADHEFTKPPEAEEPEDEEWMSLMMHGLRAACAEGKPPLYRGKDDKLFARFAFHCENSDHKSHRSLQSITNPEGHMNFADIAKKLGLDPNTAQAGILSAIDARTQQISQLQTSNQELQELVDQYKTANTNNEQKITALQKDLLKTKTGGIVEAVVEEAVKNQKGMQVNKKIRPDLVALAEKHLTALDEEDTVMAENHREHMLLKAKANLLPIGENTELTGSQTDRMETQPGGLSQDVLDKAKSEGTKALERSKKQWETATLN